MHASGLAILLTLGLALPAAAQERCEPSQCLEILRVKAGVELAYMAGGGLAGVWTTRGGLSGSRLFVLPDGTYIYTEYGCTEPERVHDKGRWRVGGGGLTLMPDADVPLTVKHDRRYVVLRSGVPPHTLVLVGAESGLARLAQRVESDRHATPIHWFDTTGFRRRRTLSPRDVELLKALLRSGWEPYVFMGAP